MEQPELGRKLAALRQHKSMTQEELVTSCNISVRTIQRIEAGEVTPRTSTIKILLTALEVDFEEFKRETAQPKNVNLAAIKWVQVAWIAGIIYLLLAPIEAFAEYLRFHLEAPLFDNDSFSFRTFEVPILAYASVKIVSFLSFSLMVVGFLKLASIFDNYLLKVAVWLMIGTLGLITALDLITLIFPFETTLDISLFLVGSIITGASSIVFGLGLLRLQDSMGKIAFVAGIFEIMIGSFFLVVFLFFLSIVLTIPATILEIVLLYKGHEFLTKEVNT